MQWSILTSGDINTDVSEYGNLVDIDTWENHADQIDVQSIRETRNRLLINRLVNSERNMIGSGLPKTKTITGIKLANDVRIAAFNYAMLSASPRPIPTIEDHLDDNHEWIHRLIETFSSTRWQEWIPPDVADPINAISIGALAMTLGTDTDENASSLWEMTGGAMRLRSGRLIGTPYNLRGPRRYPIYSSGRQTDAINRRRLARTYVTNRLNNTRNQQNENIQLNNEDASPNDQEEFHMEIMRLLEEIARQAAQAQQAPAARYLSFHNNFYSAMRSHIAESISFHIEPNPSFIKAWLINFLIAEQLSQILSILSSKLTHQTYPKPTFCQIVLIARNKDEQDLFKRIWTTTQKPYDMFLSLFNRIIKDLVSSLNIILKQPEPNQLREETEAMILESGLSDISGDIVNVLEQVTSYEQIENITVSVKLKCRGLVAFSRNENVVKAFKRWMNTQLQNYERPATVPRRQKAQHP